MFYISTDHEKRFYNLLLEDGTGDYDIERKSLFYIIAGNTDLYKKKKYFYNSKNHCIVPMKKHKSPVDLSSGARGLIQLGFQLYNGMHQDVNICHIFSSLDEQNRALAFHAIKMRFM